MASKRVPISGGHIDLTEREIVRSGQQLGLTKTEHALLTWLAARPDEVHSSSTLLQEVWGYAPQVRSRTLFTTVQRLRKKLEQDPTNPTHLVSVYAVGYRFVPAPGRPIVGRDADLDAIRAALDGGGVYTLVGPAGVGKTTLARQALREWPAGGVFVELIGAQNSRQALETAARTLGLLTVPTEDAQLLGAMIELIRHLDVGLIVLDNCEHLDRLGWVETLAEVVPLLATSREPLDVNGEGLRTVGSLDPVAAHAVFLEAAHRRSEVPLDHDIIEAICAAVDHHPLAIELAAARLELVGLDELHRRVREEVGFIGRPGAGRHDSLSGLLRGSWNRLEAPERGALGILSHLGGSFDLQMAERLIGPRAVSCLLDLVRRHLVWRRDGEGGARFGLFAAVASFVRDRGPHDIGAYIGWAVGEATFDRTRPPAEQFLRIVGLLPELLRAHGVALHADPQSAARLVVGISEPLIQTRPAEALEAILTQTMGALPSDDPERIPVLLARLKCRAQSQDVTGAHADLDVLPTRHELPPELGCRRANAEAFLLYLAVDVGPDAMAVAADALRLADAVGDVKEACIARQLAGEMHRMGRRSDQSEASLLRNVRYVSGPDVHEPLIAGTYEALVTLYQHQGRHEEAAVIDEQALAHCRSFGASLLVCRVQLRSAWRCAILGDTEAATALYDEASVLIARVGHRDFEVFRLRGMGSIAALNGDLDGASHLLGEAVTLARMLKYTMVPSTLLLRAKLRAAQGRFPSAIEDAQTALDFMISHAPEHNRESVELPLALLRLLGGEGAGLALAEPSPWAEAMYWMLAAVSPAVTDAERSSALLRAQQAVDRGRVADPMDRLLLECVRRH